MQNEGISISLRKLRRVLSLRNWSLASDQPFLGLEVISDDVFQAVHIQGQEPLTATMLAAAPPQEQKQMLGERLFPLIQRMYPELAGKITGMLLEIDNSELLHMLEHHESLKAKVTGSHIQLWL
jgi:hypothetical protein